MNTLRSFAALGRQRRFLLLQAATLLVSARVALRILPFSTLQRVLERPRPAGDKCSRVPIDRVGWAIVAAARCLPKTTCLEKALAAALMLKQHGHMPQLRIGVRGSDARPASLEAHAWVECEGRAVVGEVEHLADYAVLSAQVRP